MVVVDASVWNDVFRGAETAQVRLFEEVAAYEEMALVDLTLFEIMRGARSDDAVERMRYCLAEFGVLPLGGERLALRAARNARVLRDAGVQPSAVDCLLATYCIEHDLRFLTSDKDFEPFAVHLGLQLVR